MKKKITLVFISIFLIGIITTSVLFCMNKKDLNMKLKLHSYSYNYLPKEAKKFIEEKYQETGEIILTEKNKKINTPYLNPAYVDYMVLSEEEKENVKEIPSVYITDYVSNTMDGDTIIPSSYDLRSVSTNYGTKNFVTPIRDQANQNLCWAFTSAEQIESLLLVNSNTSYNNNSHIFSARQMDYASSDNGIISYTNDYSMRHLQDGGNYFVSSILMANGLSLVDETTFPFDESSDQKELIDVLNYSNSNYELNASEVIFDHNYTVGSNAYNNYLIHVKQNIMQYGGAYVSTQAPGTSYPCSSTNHDGYQIVRLDQCSDANNHAMQIIGWNDNYNYSYCRVGNTHSSNTSNCSSENLVTGTGAWLLRNSWGDSYQFLYLAYDSPTGAIYFTKNVTPMSSRTWDNVYHTQIDLENSTINTAMYQTFEKPINTVEKLEKIKFHTYGQNGTYTITVRDAYTNHDDVKTVTVTDLGYTTVDMSDLNIYIEGSKFIVFIQSTNSTYMLVDSISAFTSNYDSIPGIEYPHYYAQATNNGYQLTFYADTKNINSNSNINVSIYDNKGNNVSSHMSVQNNTVAINNMNAKILLDNTFHDQVYTIKTSYGGYVYEAKLLFNSNFKLDGDGTENSPFLIRTEDDLRKVSIYMDGYYRLENDITLQNKWVPIGIATNPFVGVFDGCGHTIENLNIVDSYDNAGLFGVVKAQNSATIKNLTIKNANVTGSSDSGILIGTATGNDGLEVHAPTTLLNVTNISVIEGQVVSDYGSAGSIIGSIKPATNTYYGTNYYIMDQLFSSATIAGQSSSGMVGFINGSNSSTYKPIIQMTNVENIGIIDLKLVTDKNILTAIGTHAAVTGKMNGYSSYTLAYYILSPLFRNFSYSGNGIYAEKSVNNSVTIGNGYNTLDNNVSVLTLKNASNYSQWPSFNTKWKMETIDNITRIPILSGANITYTSLSNINMNKGETTKISDIVATSNLARVYVSSNSDNTAVSATSLTDSNSNILYDLNISALKAGEVILSVVSNYDGYEKNIIVNVQAPMTNFSIATNSITLGLGDSYTIVPIFEPSDTTDSRQITWTNTTPSVASITNEGVVNALALGTTTITGSLPNGRSITLTVSVEELVPITSFIISNQNVVVNPNETRNLTTQIAPLDTNQNKTITWTSDNESVASVSDGSITGVGVGNATITGILENGMTVTVEVEVTNDTINHLKGDLNYDGDRNLDDAIVALKKIFRYIPIDELDEEIGDVDESDTVDLQDVIILLRYIFRYINEL